jgi:DMSO/TMAO reductase YedYZ molybdopterin-dependent catalytic subunit
MYSRKSLFFAVLLLWVVVAAVFVGGTVWRNETTSGARTLRPVEIREYEGQKLSSIDDFRENSIKGPQFIDNESYSLVITGLVNNEIEYTYSDVISNNQLFEKVVTLHCVEGWQVTILWEGVLVKDLIEEAGVDSKAKVVIFYAYDGYSTSLPLDYIINNDILMAYKMNGVVLPPERGFPFQLVAESKYGYKWIKWITEIEVSDNVDYRGYWESRGFSNDADLP